MGVEWGKRNKGEKKREREKEGLWCVVRGHVSKRLSRLAVIILLVVCFGECRFPKEE